MNKSKTMLLIIAAAVIWKRLFTDRDLNTLRRIESLLDMADVLDEELIYKPSMMDELLRARCDLLHIIRKGDVYHSMSANLLLVHLDMLTEYIGLNQPA